MQTESPLRAERRRRHLRLIDIRWLVKVATGREVSEATLSRLERGAVDSSAALRADIARALKVPPEKLWEAGP